MYRGSNKATLNNAKNASKIRREIKKKIQHDCLTAYPSSRVPCLDLLRFSDVVRPRTQRIPEGRTLGRYVKVKHAASHTVSKGQGVKESDKQDQALSKVVGLGATRPAYNEVQKLAKAVRIITT